MIENLTPLNGPQASGDGHTVFALLTALSTDQYKKLVGFARYRLRKLTISARLQQWLGPLEAEELVAQAVLRLEMGEANPSLGRHLKPQNRANTEAFLACLKGVIESDLNHLVRQAHSRPEHVRLGDADAEPGCVEPAELDDPERLLWRRDLHRVLFRKLYERIARQPALLEVVRDWETRFLEDWRIGGEGHDPHLVYRVSQLAQEILQELSAEFSPAPDGSEMCM
ncbi:MAG TPA: hypothetical protein VN829_08085 [Dongiaceae bacterium]|nr:hypothetical protein [Dongiaceae bacterium]HXR37725.1 hypothetical protein [Terracidiphilus sp.]